MSNRKQTIPVNNNQFKKEDTDLVGWHQDARATGEDSVVKKETLSVDKLVELLRRYLSEIAMVPLEKLDPNAKITDLGLNSLIVTEMTARLEPILGYRDPVIFYAARSIRDAAARIKLRSPNIEPSGRPFSAATISSKTSATPSVGRPDSSVTDVAIIGVSGRFPQADNVLQFEELLADGRDCIVEASGEYRTPGDELRWGGFLSEPMNFDYGHFNMSYRDALMAHPEERLLLQEAWRCFESAGYNPLQWLNSKGANIGVYIGASFHEYSELVSESNQQKREALPYSSQIFAYANRISYFYNLTGPSIAVDSACSSSLYAIFDAYNAIRFGLCDMALAGGVNLNLHHSKYEFLKDKNALSQDGRCRAFVEGGTGYVPSEGVGVILLKTLESAMGAGDNILAVIKGAAAGNDGRTQGFTVPNPDAQRDTICKAFDVAQISPQSISLIECHGTGTSLGDPIEIAALTDAFGESAHQQCPISSVKSNIGHLEAAAGIAQITKVILQLRRQQYFPNVMHHENLNPNIEFGRTPFKVQTSLEPWPVNESQPVRRAGISSFGAGGTNVHLILEQAPESLSANTPELDMDFKFIIPFSADTPEQLADIVKATYQFIASTQTCLNSLLNVRNIAATLQCGRAEGRCRLALICGSSTDVLLSRLKNYLEGHMDSTMVAGEAKANETHCSELMGTGVSITELLAVAKNWVVGRVMFERDHRARRVYLPTYVFRRDLVSPIAGDEKGESDSLITKKILGSSTNICKSPNQSNISQVPLVSASPAPDTLTLVRDTLKQVLGALPQVYTDDMLFADLGIDSILVGRIHTELCQTYPELDLFVFFEFNTAALLSSYLQSLSPENAALAAQKSSVTSVQSLPVKEKDGVGDIGALEFGEIVVPFIQYANAYHRWSKSTHKMAIETISVNGVGIECVICGEGPTLVLLPPFNSSAVIWIRQLQHLSKRHKIIVPHYPGFSRSDWVDGLDSFNDLADILVGLIDELVDRRIIPNKKLNWVGWSLGGFVAQTICKLHPRYVGKLVLISTTTVSWSSKEYMISAEDFSLKCAEEFEQNFKKLPKFLRNMPEIAVYRKERHIERFVWCTTNRRVLDCYFRMIARFRNAEAGEYVQAPTLLISGADDVLMPAKFARELSEKIPDSTYVEIENGHHFLSLFHYKTINNFLNRWFNR